VHEGNVHPGLSNRLARWIASSVAISFSESLKELHGPRVWVSGFPIRSDIAGRDAAESRRHFKLEPQRLTILIFGGSLGASHLNDAVVDAWKILSNDLPRLQVIHVTGERDYDRIAKAYGGISIKAAILAYCHEMARAYAAADLVISRAGASTTAELFVTQRPAILIPYPFASENHQFYNAEVLLKRAAAEVLLDQDLSGERLAGRLRQLLDHPERLTQMRQRLQDAAPDVPHATAAERIASFVLKDH
jgi:UDP-N-acetylglucosamine--N-acetylmuramyl-(pentapeptide) pyrophosphoryl-undecaprenol N-acetylglucosamine transferase